MYLIHALSNNLVQFVSKKGWEASPVISKGSNLFWMCTILEEATNHDNHPEQVDKELRDAAIVSPTNLPSPCPPLPRRPEGSCLRVRNQMFCIKIDIAIPEV